MSETISRSDTTTTFDPIIVKISIDGGLPRLPNSIKTVRDKMANKREWRDMVANAAKLVKYKENLKGLYDHANVHFKIRVGEPVKKPRRYDPDNLAWAVSKPALDGLVGVLLEDDSIDHVTLSYEYCRVNPRGFDITITGR